MSKSNQKQNDDLEDILNEVDNYKLGDEEEEEDNGDNINVDDLLKEEPTDQTISMMTDYGEPMHIIDFPASRPDLKNLADSNEHPLEILEKHERDISAKLGQMNLENKFLVTNCEKNMDKNYQNVSYTVLETISDHCFPDANNNLPMHNDEYWGAPKCLAVLSQKYIALGTSHAVAIVFDLGESTAKKLGTVKEQDYGVITAMDLVAKDECLVCGYESGHIVLWNIMRTEHFRTIPPSEKSPILSVKFWKDVRNNFLVSNAKGMVFLYKIEYSFFQWSIEKKSLIDLSADQKNGKKPVKAGPYDHLPDGVFSIQVLKKDLTKNHPLNKYTLVALGSMKMVLIVMLEPFVSIVYRYDRPTGLSDTIVPSISWGKGALPGEEDNKHPILALSWGQDLYLLQCQNVEEEDAKGIKLAAYYRSNSEISHLEWISESNILTYDPTREFKVLFTGLFSLPNVPKQESLGFDYAAAVINSQLVDYDIGFQIYNVDKSSIDYGGKQPKPILYYTNTISANFLIRSVFILGYKRLYFGRHYEWKEYIESMTSSSDWLHAFATLSALSKGANRVFAGLPFKTSERKEVLRQYGASMVKRYLESVEKTNRGVDIFYSEETWRASILIAIDFLVSIENFSYLFQNIKKQLESYKLHDLFMESLEPFFFKNRVKSIPNDPFREIVNYYSEKDKISVLQYLMINIDLSDIDHDFAISLCMEFNLLTALFYLCSHKAEGPEFMTPISRALSLYQRSVEQDPAGNQAYGLTVLWFISLVIKGKLFPSGTIPESIWEQKVRNVIILLFEESNLELLLRIQPHVAFEILQSLFEPKIAAVIAAFDENAMQLIGDQERIHRQVKANAGAQSLKYALDQFVASVGNKIQGQMLALIYYCSKKKRANGLNYQNLMFYMMASVAVHAGFKIPDEVMEETLFYILENERDVPKWEVIKRKSEERTEEEEINLFAEERNDLILGLLKKLEGKIREEELETVRRMTDQTEFIDVRAYLLGLKKDYKKCFELYLTQPTHFKMMKVFDWLDNMIDFVKKNQPTQSVALKEAIISNLRDLVAINGERARKVTAKLDGSVESDAIKLLEDSPKLQLGYLKSILHQKKPEEKISEELLTLYLKLLCQLYPKQILDEVKNREYPLETALKLCRQYDVKDGLAFFLEQKGEIMEAIDILLEVFKQTLEKKLKKVEQMGLFDEASLTLKLENVKEICMKHSRSGEPNTHVLNKFINILTIYKRIWFRVLDKLLECYMSYIVNNKVVQKALKSREDSPQNSGYRRFVKIFSEYISTLFDDLTRNVPVNSIIVKLQDYKALKLGDLRESLVRMLESYFFESSVLKETKDLVVDDTFDNVAELYHQTGKAVRGEKADIDADLVDNMTIYDCGHAFPSNYLQTNQCPVCAQNETQRARKILYYIQKGGNRPVSQNAIKEASAKGSVGSQGSKKSLAGGPEGFLHHHRDDKKEKYLRKLMIIEQKRVESAGDWEDLADSHNFF